MIRKNHDGFGEGRLEKYSISNSLAAYSTACPVRGRLRENLQIAKSARHPDTSPFNTWFEEIKIAEKSLIICWYHLVKKCRDLIGTIGVDAVRRREILSDVLKYLWRGKVDKIIHYLTSQKVANPLSLHV